MLKLGTLLKEHDDAKIMQQTYGEKYKFTTFVFFLSKL